MVEQLELEEVESMFWGQIKCKWFRRWTKEVSMEQDNQEQQLKVDIFSVDKLEEEDHMLPLAQSWIN